ncbi:vesicle-associated membrane protein 1 isoform X2 [Hemicordylus capensis]|uniref:vesicle-associated membrane protein 1 isoform X2 n=1 Tax=Hemicordylus capensis TaxID=884348 RepID=UPI0023033FC3|nr:vesicle-associated membrane protein 1 isoform X2 [Hemicordylus capensis]
MSDPVQSPATGTGPEGESARGPPEAPPNMTSNRRLYQTQAEVAAVVHIFHDNVEKVLKRDEDLLALEAQAEGVHDSAKVFQTNATSLARKYWWQNAKMMVILGIICAIVAVAVAHDAHTGSDLCHCGDRNCTFCPQSTF